MSNSSTFTNDNCGPSLQVGMIYYIYKDQTVEQI